MSDRLNPYAVLGLHPSADGWAVKRAYRQLIRECHPDVAGAEATARAAAVTAAYEILGDAKRRAEFDHNIGNILNGWTDKSRYLTWRTVHCLQCGTDLHQGLGDATYSPSWRSKRHDALYCSNACRQRAYRARQAAMKAARRQLEKPDP